MSNIFVDFEKVTGAIKPMHGVGQPPFYGNDYSMIDYLKDAKIPYSRLHDVQWPYGSNKFVDIHNIFRNFDADPSDPEAYDFSFTDLLITALVERGVEPFFRLGESIENYVNVRAYYVFPPKDNLKWAKVCEGIIRHYTEGWANGFHYDIKYWEIWNEPEGKEMWMGTKEEFFELYNVTSKYLKKTFPHLKIGGYASCGFYAIAKAFDASKANIEPRFDYYVEYFKDFMEYIQENNCPMDFFSWHSYDSIENNIKYAEYARQKLDEAGYSHTEQTLNEWNCEVDLRGSSRHAALTAGMMLALQDTSLDSAMFYDAAFSVSDYAGLFNPYTRLPHPSYYSFVAFAELHERKNQVEVKMDIPNVYACAAKGEDGCLVIANTNKEAVDIELTVNGMQAEKCKMIADGCVWQECELPKQLPAHSVVCIYYK